MSSRLATVFRRTRERGGAFAGFLAAGDPDPETAEEMFSAMAEAGVEIIEVGMPYSEPTADGPVICRAYERALRAGHTMEQTLALCGRLRARWPGVAIVLMGYANPVWIQGVEAFCRRAALCGVDGLLLVDWPYEEDHDIYQTARLAGLDWIRMIAPTTDSQRLPLLLGRASGFLYLASRTGVTGAGQSDPQTLVRSMEAIRALSTLPVVAGFGVADRDGFRQVCRHCDGAVVGSALVSAVHEGGGDRQQRRARLIARIRDLRPSTGGAHGSLQ